MAVRQRRRFSKKIEQAIEKEYDFLDKVRNIAEDVTDYIKQFVVSDDEYRVKKALNKRDYRIKKSKKSNAKKSANPKGILPPPPSELEDRDVHRIRERPKLTRNQRANLRGW